jgi:integrase
VKGHLAKHVGKSADSRLFPAKSGDHFQPSTFQRHFYRGRNKAKRPDLRLHDCRHTGAVLAAQTGATLAELMARLGTSRAFDPQAVMRYQHAAQVRDKAIARALSSLVNNAD